MKFRRRNPTDRDLLSWLDTGLPSFVDKLLDDQTVIDRLERLTALPTDQVAALASVVSADEATIDRLRLGVSNRIVDLERAGALLGLLGVGPLTVRHLAHGDDS